MTNLEVDMDDTSEVGSVLRNGLGAGLEDGGEFILQHGVKAARRKVVGHDRVWNKKVKHGFEIEGNDFSRGTHWQGWIHNVAPHAKVVDVGIAPAGQVTDSSPSVQDIIGWVETTITPSLRAKKQAENANLEEWDADARLLAETYGTAEVIAAFGIALHIRDKGYPGIHFSHTAESKMKQQSVNMKRKVESKMNERLREAGLK